MITITIIISRRSSSESPEDIIASEVKILTNETENCTKLKGNFTTGLLEKNNITQGIDGSARKPALRQDTGYMVEKTYLDIAPYLGAFGAYVMPQ